MRPSFPVWTGRVVAGILRELRCHTSEEQRGQDGTQNDKRLPHRLVLLLGPPRGLDILSIIVGPSSAAQPTAW